MIPLSLYGKDSSLERRFNEDEAGEDLERKTTILLADDSEDVLKMLSVNLQKRGYAVLCYENKMSAIVAVKKMHEEGQGLPLIISDIMSPVTDGFEFLRRVKALFLDAKFMFLTASGEAEYVNRARQMGANAYIKKPVDLNALYDAIEKVLSGDSFFQV